MIPVNKEKNEDFMNENSLDEYIFNSLYKEDMEKEKIKAEDELTGAVLSLSEEKIDHLRSSIVKIQEEEKSSEGLIMKELPKHLKYVFLGEEKSKPVTIAADLTTEKGEKVKEILIRHKEATAWLVEDLKGINQFICMHKIIMEENSRTFIEHQRRLNPVMKEVVMKEVLKWLNVIFIYAISDNPCVTP